MLFAALPWHWGIYYDGFIQVRSTLSIVLQLLLLFIFRYCGSHTEQNVQVDESEL